MTPLLEFCIVAFLYKGVYNRLPQATTCIGSAHTYASLIIPYPSIMCIMFLSLPLTCSFQALLGIIMVLEIHRPNPNNFVIRYADKTMDVDRLWFFAVLVVLYSCLQPSILDIVAILGMGSTPALM